ncbi:hypothetical protein SAMN04244572_04712 [Azotobacter beijerinckii]|uniref:Uncharacterized protein n=1 Tax=Azotobacter beijerinckii TaxID=170623 RepID=A0A1H7ADJ7_9GAMM|nr:hypothetical protein [Azotobacter beijerinckii]SEJ63006.1 hypothetical protein SAMN04244572_04712 [Azotobacter beijerinckii]
MNAVHAIFCRERDELMIDSGRIFKVPPQVARTVSADAPDTRFVKSWAVMYRLIPAHAQVTFLQSA